MVWNEIRALHGETFELFGRLEVKRVTFVIFGVSCCIFLHVFKVLQRFAYRRLHVSYFAGTRHLFATLAYNNRPIRFPDRASLS